MSSVALRTLAERYAAPVPRYTSYPTAPHFNSAVGAREAAAWISSLPSGVALSLYVHIPFCRALCWYCGCATTVVNGPQPVTAYLGTLQEEMAHVAALVPPSHRVTHLHWGGGSPNSLAAGEICSLAERTREMLHLDAAAEFAVEIDPRFMDGARVAAFRRAGVNRVSIGVQDFDPKVQAAINRYQPYEVTRQVVTSLREAGITSLNIDLVYGLPGQTQASVARTLEQVLTLDPDRIAVFGYAHLPERIRHQRLIDTSALAGPADRLGQANRVARKLLAHGYVRVGLDHFAKPTDPLVTGPINRNFQGYTTDTAETLIGFGASAISRFPQGYAQNAARVPDYQERVARRRLGTARGVALSEDDRVRSYVIERLMCDLVFSETDLSARFGAEAAAPVIADSRLLLEADRDGLVAPTPDGMCITERGRPFVRSICACFDAYLDQSTARHAVGV
ncbi:oxygen-independent coproporphyrinogen III oxidase [Hyphomicrobium sp.]|uniref:oxygen-independent coproporphyrinogen III oxidase n=1 Tax=Hyphomicrobium sp. TaxID=82 RepID=UPI0025BBDAAB|nr:oxygen-independent coproporphyrinogen III oxidase [Hyphomicrobium sp.]MCC7253496.1 oxygen-independent coproporphyrinogen III oxidase [Hyphomicrobium sp.]